MKPVAKTHHLQRRGPVYYYYRRVPSDLIDIAQKAVIKKSLGTTSFKEAVKLRTIEDLHSDAWFDELRAGLAKAEPGQEHVPVTASMIGQGELLSYVRAMVDDEATAFEKRLINDPPADEDEKREMEIEAETSLGILTAPGDSRSKQDIFAFGRKMLKRHNRHPDEVADISAFNDLLRRALIELERRKLDRYHDDHAHQFHDQLFSPDAEVSLSFGELAKIYLDEQRQKFEINFTSSKRADKLTAEVDLIVRIIGPDVPVTAINDDMVQKVRTYLAKLPANVSKRYPDVSLEKAIELAEKAGRSPLAWQTQNSYIAALKGILQTGVRKKYLQSNPAEDVEPIKKQVVAAKDRRKPLSPQQLGSLIDSEFYRSCAPGAKVPYKKPDKQWRFWFPLLMLYSGARPNEIAQLRVRDIRKTDTGTVYLDLVDEEKNKQLKTETSRRRIPLHPALRKTGFLDFVEERKKGKGEAARLFDALKPDKYGNLAWYPCKRFNEKFLPDVMEVEPRQSLYSLRHNFRDALRHAKAPPDALQALGGWANGTAVSDHYGDPGNPDLYVSYIEAIEYKGVDLSFLEKHPSGE